jgi:hypothetical protein
VIENFEQKSSELYRLAYLLTGNSDRGVEAFSRALDFEEEKNPVFGGFMNAWARKLVAVEALGTMEKELRASKQRAARTAGDETAGKAVWKRRAEISQEEFEEAVIAIDAFPRCAMLLTIFEGMSIEAAAVLLHADESLTAAAQRMGIVQLTSKLAGGGGRDPFPGLSPIPVLSFN